MRRVATVVVAVGSVVGFGEALPGPAWAADAPANRAVVMYFHRTERCPTCLKMGSYAEEAVKTGFAQRIRGREVEFHYIDFQDEKNTPLTKAYRVSGPTLIVAKVSNGQVKQAENLEEIWSKVGDKPEFLKYVQEHVGAALTPADRVVAIYFHRTQRCPTCLKMGSYSEEVVKSRFAKRLKDGTVEFHYIDFQKKDNAALTDRYRISGPALIVAKIVDNKVAEFANLEDIWTKVADKKGFLSYVQEQISAYHKQILQKPAVERGASSGQSR